MNLHGIVRGAINSVNPDIPATLLRNEGYNTDDTGKRTPVRTETAGTIQVQPLSTGDINHTNNLNIQGVLRAVYLHGHWFGVMRSGQTGGDMLRFKDQGSAIDQNWLVVNVMEAWPDWTKVIVCLQ
jgi:hypothetical protein